MFCPECGMRFVKTIERDGIKLRVCANGHEIENQPAKKIVLIRTITFHADEGEVFLMKCKKCNKNFRSGSGGGRGA